MARGFGEAPAYKNCNRAVWEEIRTAVLCSWTLAAVLMAMLAGRSI